MLLRRRGFACICILQRDFILESVAVHITAKTGTNSRHRTSLFLPSINTNNFGGSFDQFRYRNPLQLIYMTTTTTQSPTENSGNDNNKFEAVGQKDIGSTTVEEELPLDESSEDIPYDGSTNKLWRQFLEISIARTRKIRGSNYVQIATVDSTTNEPRCRTVVFRGFLNVTAVSFCDSKYINGDVSMEATRIADPKSKKALSCMMKMCTDARSEKVHQTGPTEIVWWFPKTSEQYRIRGQMILIGSSNTDSIGDSGIDRELLIARKEMWGSLTDASRESFLTKERPGDEYIDSSINCKDEDRTLYGGRDVDGKIIQPPPDTFLLMLVVPNRCDYLNLSNMYRQIDAVTVDDDGSMWQSKRVNP